MGTPNGWVSGYGHFAVYGSNDNTSWTHIESFTEPAQTHQADGELGFDLEFSSPQSYRYFKVVADTDNIRCTLVSGGDTIPNIGGIQYEEATVVIDPLTQVDSLSSTVDASVSTGAPFKADHRFNSHPLYGFHVDDTSFVERDRLSSATHLAYGMRNASFAESDALSSTGRVRIHAIVGIINSLLVGSSCVVINSLGTVFDIPFWNSIDSVSDSVVAFSNVLSDSAITSIASFVNELAESSKVTSCIAVATIIGEEDLSARSSFWGQGPVVHREGSHGGYE